MVAVMDRSKVSDEDIRNVFKVFDEGNGKISLEKVSDLLKNCDEYDTDA